MTLLDLRLREFLDEVAAEGRTPGGGSAAALVTAIAAGLLAKGLPGLRPCTPAGVLQLLKRHDVELEGAEAVVVGRSDLVGKPIAFASTGVLFPFFSPLLGWLGVALTGSDTSSNVLFGGLQQITARQVGVSPVLAAAAYSVLLLASLQAFGAERGKAYAPLPKWRRNARRPSCLDLITLLRKEMAQHPELLAPFGFQITAPALVQAAAA